MNEELQLSDIEDGYRFVATCPKCEYRASVDPVALLSHDPEAKYWTRFEVARRLRCRRCKTKLLHDYPDSDPPSSVLHRRLALERPARKPIAFQGGMLFGE